MPDDGKKKVDVETPVFVYAALGCIVGLLLNISIALWNIADTLEKLI